MKGFVGSIEKAALKNKTFRTVLYTAKHWGVGVEMFGEIEDLSNAGSFNDQDHSIGPTLFWKPGEKEDEGEGKGDENNHKIAGPPEMDLSFNVGVQFGLTDATSDTALKFQGSLSF